MKYREHRGAYAASMSTLVEIEPTKAALIGRIRAQHPTFVFDDADLTVEQYCYDPRCKWDTFIVSVIGGGVMGFTDGAVL